MPRNRSEKLPDIADGWSPAAIKFLRELGVELANAYSLSDVRIISSGDWTESRAPESVRAFQRVSRAVNDAYNLDRRETYKLIAHFFEEAHAQKSK